MPRLEIAAIVLITLALAFYSLGVWAVRLRRSLAPWHVAAFWTGLAFDLAGTTAMDLMTPGFDWHSIHTITGQVALWLMLGHTVWATWVLRRGTDDLRRGFHRFSLVVWCIWLVPYFGGMVLGMRR